jgi:hypothetical protein
MSFTVYRAPRWRSQEAAMRCRSLVSMSTTRRNDLALIGIVLLACGIAMLASGATVAERVLLVGTLWSAAAAAFVAARR